MKRRSIGVAVVLSAVSAAGVVLSGCEKPQPPPLEPPKVTVTRPVVTDVQDYADFTGRLEPTEVVEIRARVQGFLDSAGFTDGAMVEKGQLLFVIEKEPFEAELAAAQAKVKQTEAAVALADANKKRAEQLIARNAISQEEYQTNVAEHAAAEAQLLATQAQLRQAEINLGYTDIVAPFAGRVGEKLVDPGNLVGAGENTLLTTVVKMDPLYGYFDVSEKVVNRYLRRKNENPNDTSEAPAAAVYLGLADEEGYPHEGVLDYLDSRIDPATGTAMIRGTFPNWNGVLYPGNFARLRIPLDTLQGAVMVHEEALGTDLGGKYLLIVDGENKVELRHVELGILAGGMRVINRGIAPTERYVLKGLLHARPGFPVVPEMVDPGEPPAIRSPEAAEPPGGDSPEGAAAAAE